MCPEPGRKRGTTSEHLPQNVSETYRVPKTVVFEDWAQRYMRNPVLHVRNVVSNPSRNQSVGSTLMSLSSETLPTHVRDAPPAVSIHFLL